MQTLLPHRTLAARIIDIGGRQTIQLNNEVVVSHADLIRMDGVVHKIDQVLLPPRIAKVEGSEEEQVTEQGAISKFLAWLWPWDGQDGGVEVMELMERLQPLLEERVR